jgi:hypothetical protein
MNLPCDAFCLLSPFAERGRASPGYAGGEGPT